MFNPRTQSHPKDVPIEKIELCEFYNSKHECVFKAVQAEVATSYSNGTFSGNLKFTIIATGTPIPKYIHTLLDGQLSFVIKIKRLDVIEVLKYGNYITMKGKGYGIEYSYPSEYGTVKLTFEVLGNIDIQ